jgi:hypothetical protein
MALVLQSALFLSFEFTYLCQKLAYQATLRRFIHRGLLNHLASGHDDQVRHLPAQLGCGSLALSLQILSLLD